MVPSAKQPFVSHLSKQENDSRQTLNVGFGHFCERAAGVRTVLPRDGDFNDRFHVGFHIPTSDAALSRTQPDAASVAPGPCRPTPTGERTMPLIEVHLIEDVFDPAQKKQMIEKLTDAMVSIEGENMRGVTWVKISEVSQRRMGYRRSAADHRSGEGACRGQKSRLTTIGIESGLRGIEPRRHESLPIAGRHRRPLRPPETQRALRHADFSSSLAEKRRGVGGELEGVQILLDAKPRLRPADCLDVSTCLLDSAREHVTERGDREDQDMGVRLHRRLDRPCRGLVELAEPHVGHRLASQHAKQKRIERAEQARVVGGLDRGTRIARLRMYESQGVVAEREVRTEVHGLLQFTDRFIVAALEPKRTSHRPMRRGIVFVDDQPAPCGLQRMGHVMFAIAPMLERALPMGERKAGMGAGKGRIQSHGHLEKPPRPPRSRSG